ncbi:hypothetical protein [Methylocaldum szegediense]|uniref:Uncharacterized protein n=1 Tax=Methylocaldum szegediense TaxID=73780 RepID=A0ABM9I0H6_9GAMM|nr:hypothetical protein [Methylocaldum szegediense]CAI8809384.1 protein of unknown function [Methylocaldum szegediense]
MSTLKKPTEVVTLNCYAGSQEIAVDIRHLSASAVQRHEQWS